MNGLPSVGYKIKNLNILIIYNFQSELVRMKIVWLKYVDTHLEI